MKIFIVAAIIVFVVLFGAMIVDFINATKPHLYSDNGNDKGFRSAVTFDKIGFVLIGLSAITLVAIYVAFHGLEIIEHGGGEE